MSYHIELLKRMKALEEDHEPDGWPAVQMKDITALRQMIEGAKILRRHPHRLHWAHNDWGKDYWLDGGNFVGDLETAFYEVGKQEAE